MLNTVFEIHHTDGTILADNLLFEDLPILFQAYQEWYGEDSVIACYRNFDGQNAKYSNRRDDFYKDWGNFVDYLIALDNI